MKKIILALTLINLNYFAKACCFNDDQYSEIASLVYHDFLKKFSTTHFPSKIARTEFIEQAADKIERLKEFQNLFRNNKKIARDIISECLDLYEKKIISLQDQDVEIFIDDHLEIIAVIKQINCRYYYENYCVIL